MAQKSDSQGYVNDVKDEINAKKHGDDKQQDYEYG